MGAQLGEKDGSRSLDIETRGWWSNVKKAAKGWWSNVKKAAKGWWNNGGNVKTVSTVMGWLGRADQQDRHIMDDMFESIQAQLGEKDGDRSLDIETRGWWSNVKKSS